MARSKSGWHREDIKAAVRKTGFTLKALALKNGLCESACRMALISSQRPAGEKAITEHLNINPHAIWPDRYHPDGTRSIGRNSTAAARSSHCQKSEVA